MKKYKKNFDEFINYLKNKYPNKEFEYFIINNKESFKICTQNLLNKLYLSEYILINGNKTDRTYELFKEFNIKLI